MATHGTISKINPPQEDWQSYIKQLQQYFIANNVADAGKQCAILLSSVGSSYLSAPVLSLRGQTSVRQVVFTIVIVTTAARRGTSPRPVVPCNESIIDQLSHRLDRARNQTTHHTGESNDEEPKYANKIFDVSEQCPSQIIVKVQWKTNILQGSRYRVSATIISKTTYQRLWTNES